MSVLLLTTIVMLVAAVMAGVFTMNMNITQRVSNGTLALNEAEAGVAEVLYQITRDENVSEQENARQEPIIDWGNNSETIRGTITPGMSSDEAFHIVTFDSGESYPHSTNNTRLDKSAGSMGRTIPDGKIHIVSTGYCKGQYRTVECIVERPPFPFGLATSGAIVSEDPIVVKGTSGVDAYKDGEDDRPGHILCNSPEGITINNRPELDTTTEISGFVKSAGPVNIQQPAVVRGGIRSFADISTLADIDVTSFRNQGQPGVVTLLDSEYGHEQEMDVMYYHAGPALRYTQRVNLNKSMLYVDGNLTIDGPLTGEGLIVVNGDATFNSGTSLYGVSRMAVLASGNITIRGSVDPVTNKTNFFSGLIYTEGNLNASDITIMGNTIVNSPSPTGGRAVLRNVTVVSNEETGNMTVEVTSSTKAKGGNNNGENPPPVGDMGFPFDPENPDRIRPTEMGGSNDTGYVQKNDDQQENNKSAMMEYFWGVAQGGEGIFPSIGPIPVGLNPDGRALWGELYDIHGKFLSVHNAVQAWLTQQREMDGMDPSDDGYDEEQKELQRLWDIKEEKLKLKDELQTQINEYVDSVYDYVGSYTNKNGTFSDEIHELDIDRDIRFDLNKYLPESEKIKMSFWKVYPRRMQ